MRGNKTQDVTPEDKDVPVYPDDPVKTQQWAEIMKLVDEHNMYRPGVIVGGRMFGAPAVMTLIQEILEENKKRVKNKMPKINVSAKFRQRIRLWHSTDSEEAAHVSQELHYAEVHASYDAGYRADPEQLIEGVAKLVVSEDPDNAGYGPEELAMADRFLKSMAQ